MNFGNNRREWREKASKLVTMKRDSGTAYHEAGHAIIAWSFGFRVKQASIVSDGSSAGRIFHEKIVRGRYPDDIKPSVRDRFEKLAMISLAGLEAQRMHKGASVRSYHASSDHQVVADCALRLGGSEQAANLYIKLLLLWTRARLKNFWPEVEMLARQLLVKGSLTETDIRRIILSAREAC
jgi:hypothetical protein